MRQSERRILSSVSPSSLLSPNSPRRQIAVAVNTFAVELKQTYGGKIVKSFCMSLVIAVAVSAGVNAQVATGTPPYGSFSQGTFDTVNLANLNVHFAIPILSKPGRGVPFHYAMDYESSIWVPTNVNSSVVGPASP